MSRQPLIVHPQSGTAVSISIASRMTVATCILKLTGYLLFNALSSNYTADVDIQFMIQLATAAITLVFVIVIGRLFSQLLERRLKFFGYQLNSEFKATHYSWQWLLVAAGIAYVGHAVGLPTLDRAQPHWAYAVLIDVALMFASCSVASFYVVKMLEIKRLITLRA